LRGQSRFGLHCSRSQPGIFLWIIHNLRLVLVEIETGIKLRLSRKKIFQAAFVLEGPCGAR
jgi:hypothetical protein